MISKNYLAGVLFTVALTLGIVNESTAATINASKNNGPTTITSYTLSGTDATVEIGSAADPISVSLDPTQGGWIKQIPIDTSQPPIFPGISFTLDEYLIIEGSSWSDWHEEIMTDEWQWADDPNPVMLVQRPSDSGFIVAPGLSSEITDNSTKLNFFFDPLPEGTIVNILKEVEYTGVGDFNGIVEIKQYPTTPESSSTIGILALGIIGGGATLKRKLKSANSTEK